MRFIDLECFIWSTVPADLTPMMNAGMVRVEAAFLIFEDCSCVPPWKSSNSLRPLPLLLLGLLCAEQVFCDRHYGGINYPKGGVGRIPELLAEGPCLHLLMTRSNFSG